MASLLLTRNQFHFRKRFREPISVRIRAGKFFLTFAALLLVGLISFLYLKNATDLYTKGQILRKLEAERETLITEQETKTMNVSRIRSLSHIEQSAPVQKMLPQRNVQYLKPETEVAKAK